MTLGQRIDDKVVTVVFGNGVPALQGTAHAYDEYVLLDVSVSENKVTSYCIPLTSIAYIRISG